MSHGSLGLLPKRTWSIRTLILPHNWRIVEREKSIENLPDGILSADEPDENHDDGDDQQNVDEPSDSVDPDDAEEPQNEEDNRNSFKHIKMRVTKRYNQLTGAFSPYARAIDIRSVI